jgi:hypothetical protein
MVNTFCVVVVGDGGVDIRSVRNDAVDVVVTLAIGQFLSHLQDLMIVKVRGVPLTPALAP